MTSLLSRLTRRTEARSIQTIDDYIAALGGFYNGSIEQTLVDKRRTRGAQGDFTGNAATMAGNGVVYTCMAIRLEVFSQVRFRFQRLRDGKPAGMFATPELRILERPWRGGTLEQLLERMIQDADLCGNSYWVRDGEDLVRLRPDWVYIAAERRTIAGGHAGWRKLGVIYYEGGTHSGVDGVAFTVDEVAHFMPMPDPLNEFRGMSWLTPVLREVESDNTMTRHKRKFFENGATPNMIIKHAAGADRKKILDFQKRLDADASGTNNAYKTLNLYPGADATVVGATLSQIDFKSVQGAGETRVAAAAGVPPTLAGLSEGLQGSSLNAGNYGQSRRRFADITMHKLWTSAAGALQTVLASPGPDVKLSQDIDNIPFLREDEADASEIASNRASTVSTLINAGYTPESVVAAVEADDFRLLQHTGLFSVQLWAPGGQPPGQQTTPALPAS